MRRALILLLFGLVLAGGAAVTWQAMGKAKLIQEDLTTARALLARAGGFESGELKQRLGLVEQAERHSRRAQQRLDQWPLRQLGALPLVGRDIRVAKAVAASATGTVRATHRVVTALQPVRSRSLNRASILGAAEALLGLHDRLERDLDQVRAARPLFIAGTRTRYMEAAGSASVTAERAGQGLTLAADLYGPSGATRWFLAFQNPAELRGTGGLIGEYGILESSPAGPELVKVDHYDALNERTNEAVALPGQLTARYERSWPRCSSSWRRSNRRSGPTRPGSWSQPAPAADQGQPPPATRRRGGPSARKSSTGSTMSSDTRSCATSRP